MGQIGFERVEVWANILEGGNQAEFGVKEQPVGLHLHHWRVGVALWAALWGQ